jgi:Lon protease-like protein
VSVAAWNAGEVRDVPLFPLPDIVLFPGMRLPLHVFEPRYRRLVRDTLAGERLVALPRLKPGFEEQYYESPPVFEVCGVGRVTEHQRLADGRWNIVVEGLWRVELLKELTTVPYRLARARSLAETALVASTTLTAIKSELLDLVRRLAPHLARSGVKIESLARDAQTTGECADALAALVVSDPDERQALLEELDPLERSTRLVSRLHELLTLAGAERSTPKHWN